MKTVISLVFLSFFLVLFEHATAQQTRRNDNSQPNIIVVLCDDMGFSDLGCYGGEIATPNLDRLGMNGLRYTQFYNMDHCAPSRASLLTGLYPHQTGLGWMPNKNFHLPGYTDELNNNCLTIAEVLKTAGYTTLMAGKWHLCRDTKAGEPNYNWPLQRGFDKFYGILTGAGNYYDPPSLCRGNTLITPQNDPKYQSADYYFTHAITDNAIQFIKDRPKDKPFFTYVAYTAAHWPMQAPAEAIEKYKGKYHAGWDELRRERLKREKQLGVIDSTIALSPLDTKPWVEEQDKPAMERRMETYAAMVSIMDQGIGKIVNELKKEGIYENTVIIYLQDNGGNAEGTGYGKGQDGKRTFVAGDTSKLRRLGKDDIQYAVVPGITHNGEIAITGKKVMAGPENTYLAYLKPWANLSNTPFRKFKNFTYEGGIATPLIIHWPRGIQSKKGAIRKQVAHEIDILPTIIQLAHANYPEAYNGHTITPVSGVSLVPTFRNQDLKPRAVYWEHQGNKAMRLGKWKIVSGGILHGGYGNWKSFTALPWQLYNMENDRSELKDLSAAHPEVVHKMAGMWKKWAHQTNVYPMPWKEEAPEQKSYYMSTPWNYSNF